MMKKITTIAVLMVLCIFATTASASEKKAPTCPRPGQPDPYKAMDIYYKARLGVEPRTYKVEELAQEQAESTEKQYKAYADKMEQATKNANQKDFDFLGNCIAGINMNIFSGSFAGLYDAIVAAVQKKMCNFSLQKSNEYINQALGMMQYDLPMGVGTIGADTNILGYTITSAGTTSLGNSGINKAASVQSDAGWTMFQNGGSMLMTSGGVRLP